MTASQEQQLAELQTDMDGGDPHLVGWHRDGTPIYRGTQRQFEDAVDLAVIAIDARQRTIQNGGTK